MTQATDVVRFAWAADSEEFRLSSSFRCESPKGQIDSKRLIPASLAGFDLLVVMIGIFRSATERNGQAVDTALEGSCCLRVHG